MQKKKKKKKKKNTEQTLLTKEGLIYCLLCLIGSFKKGHFST